MNARINIVPSSPRIPRIFERRIMHMKILNRCSDELFRRQQFIHSRRYVAIPHSTFMCDANILQSRQPHMAMRKQLFFVGVYIKMMKVSVEYMLIFNWSEC